MKILVTGGLGFIGHNVVNLLEQQGHDVAIVDTQTTYGIIDRRELDLLITERMQKIRTRRIYYLDISAREIQQLCPLQHQKPQTFQKLILIIREVCT